ncbi:cellulose biosynthesis protein BcsN [Methylobacterium sp. NEAU 140]|uniref:cellulose biosynthesis protein BcsN n=1 Tax=Methylobacterium sp. NEAU 140 TaxID=3064945 RepID=UPI002734CDE7|nr:cellulose biosynthesis protein BcsN [Methylobacterium sp. NEAU 140]MDP4022413.1 cellulose biosynthesis protein BcsN [Methylobacterium sp. NEAU 140]
MMQRPILPPARRPGRLADLGRGRLPALLVILGAVQAPAPGLAAPNAPLVSVPNSGRVASVDETRPGGGLRQRITYGGFDGGWADLSVGAAGAGRGGLLGRPTKAGIDAELAALGDGPYRIVRTRTHNAYGPIGVALGARCVFAWQWIDDARALALPGTTLGPGRTSASLRVRHCGAASPDRLVADLVHLRLGAGPAAQAAASRPRRRPAPRPAPAAEAAPVEPAPVVSLPPPARPTVTVNGSRTLISLPPAPGPGTATGPSPVAVPIPRPGAAGSETSGEPRYLADGGAVRTVVPAPSAPKPQPLSSELPAQAYRGPAPPPLGW